jgi:signal peptidase I
MFSFFLPKAVKHGRQFAQDARKMEAYKRDLWDETTRTEFSAGIAALELANKSRDAKRIEDAARHLDGLCHKYLPKIEDAGWRENVEVFLVAIVIALAVRTFFLQPFTIPTGSMQPTLNGILATATTEPPPNPLVQIAHTAFLGRTWVNTVAKDDEIVATIEPAKRYYFFEYTKVSTSRLTTHPDGSKTNAAGGNVYFIHAPMNTVTGATSAFKVESMKTYKKGEPIARGYINTGDHVFVDKMSYHFRKPRRGDVFVFNTQSISKMGDPGPPPKRPSQFYIKRLTGTPGDELRIDPPALYLNGKVAEEAGLQRVMAQQDGYRGYSNAAEQIYATGEKIYTRMTYLSAPDASFTVPPKHYFAMGDNSFHSSDSRDWGPVPQENIMGRGIFVYWPFTSHWSLIR